MEICSKEKSPMNSAYYSKRKGWLIYYCWNETLADHDESTNFSPISPSFFISVSSSKVPD